MSNVNHILSKLSATRKLQTKIKMSKVHLGQLQDLEEKIDSEFAQYESILSTLNQALSSAISEAQPGLTLAQNAENNAQEVMALIKNVQDLGLDVPDNLNDMRNRQNIIIETDFGYVIGAMEEALKFIQQARKS